MIHAREPEPHPHGGSSRVSGAWGREVVCLPQAQAHHPKPARIVCAILIPIRLVVFAFVVRTFVVRTFVVVAFLVVASVLLILVIVITLNADLLLRLLLQLLLRLLLITIFWLLIFIFEALESCPPRRLSHGGLRRRLLGIG